MKVAVSIPDEVFADAEMLAGQLKTTRSDIYTRALSEFLQRHTPERVTELMNRVVQDVGAEPDPFRTRAAGQIFKCTHW
jgi:metal-responsive CopG/Arc/MetJ family transcriptional regulator